MKRNREIDKLRLKTAFGDDLFVRYLLGKNVNEVIYYLRRILEIDKSYKEALTDILKLYE